MPAGAATVAALAGALGHPLAAAVRARPAERPSETGGRLIFFGRDGQVLLELSRDLAEVWECQKRWVATPRKPF